MGVATPGRGMRCINIHADIDPFVFDTFTHKDKFKKCFSRLQFNGSK